MNQDLVKQYAPEVRLHTDEKYFPCDIESYLSNCDLVDPVKGVLSTSVVSNDFIDYNYISTTSSCQPSDAYLQINNISIRSGAITNIKDNKLHNVPVYTNIISDEYQTDIQYFFFYAYNGAIIESLPTFGTHEGDWEHITVRLDKNKKLIGIFFGCHGRESKWVRPSNIKFNDDNHPIIYSSKFLHASYPTESRQSRIGFGLIDDYTNNGYVWNTWENIIILPKSYEEATKETAWVFFNGRWGKKVRRLYGENPPPYGPGMKQYFYNRDPPTIFDII